MNKLGLLAVILLVFASFVSPQTPEETVTSVSQIKDVKPTDEFYGDLKKLIEIYGVRKLTVNYNFNPNQPLNLVDYEKLVKQGKDHLVTFANFTPLFKDLNLFDLVTERDLFEKNCSFKTAYLSPIPESEIAKSLKCIFKIEDLKIQPSEKATTRGRFAVLLQNAIDQAGFKIIARSDYKTLWDNKSSAETVTQTKPVSSPRYFVTSISQIKDVKSSDYFYSDLQSLIERYGIGNLTRDFKFNPAGLLESVEYINMAVAGKKLVQETALRQGIPENEVEALWGKNCVSKENMFVMKETVVSKWLGCMYGVGDITADAKDVLVTRGKFAVYLNTAIDRGIKRVGSLALPKPKPTQTTPATPQKTWSNYLSEGTDKLKKKDYDGAIESLTQCLNQVRNFFCLQSRATAYAFKKDYKSALKDLDEAIAKNDEEAELLSLRAQLRIRVIDGKDSLADLNNFFGASLDLDRAIKLDPKNPRWHLERAQVHCLKKEEKFLAKIEEQKVRELGGKVLDPCK